MTAPMAIPRRNASEAVAIVLHFDTAHTEVAFEAKYLMIAKVRGRFGTVNGTIVLDEADFTRSSVKVEIETANIETSHEQLDNLLRSADFFDAERFPTMTFSSRRIERVSGERFRIVGQLTLRDITREVVLDAIDVGRGINPWRERRAYNATTTIDRRDFGLTGHPVPEAGSMLVGNEIRILIEVFADPSVI